MAETKQATRTKKKTHYAEPKMYRVRMHNDDFTTMDFVVMVLSVIFHKTEAEATSLMLEIHNQKSAVVGTYPLDIALTKVSKTHNLAKENGFPLHLSIEEE